MNTKKNAKLGFTLVELMMASLAFSMLALAVGSMLVFGWQGWKRSNDVVGMQRDATLAMMMISKEIRNATYDQIIDGPGISFGGSGASFSESGNQIVRNDGMVIVDGWLQPGSFITTRQLEEDAAGQTNRWVEVAFTLKTTIETEPYSIKVSPRNGS